MKKIIILISLVAYSLSIIAVNVPKWKNENYYWKYFEDIYLGFNYQIRTFNTDIKIQLIGDYTGADSLYIVELISELSPLIRKEKIYMVTTNGNLTVHLNNNPDTSNRKKDTNLRNITNVSIFADTIRKSKHYKFYAGLLAAYYNIRTSSSISRGAEGISNSKVFLTLNNDAPQIIRYKHLEYLIITSLIVNDNKVKFDNRRKYRDSTFMFTGSPILVTSFHEEDKFVLYKAYSRFLFFELLQKKPKPALEYLKSLYGNYSYLLAFCLCFFVVLIYFLVLLRLKVIENQANNWTSYMKKGMLVMQSATLMYILYAFCEQKLFYSNASTFSFFLILLAIPNLYSFLSLNFIYFAEKLFIRTNAAIATRLFIQLIISVIPIKAAVFVVYYSFNLRNNVMFVSFMVTYGLLMIFMRIAYNYLQFKTQNAIKEKDLELSHIREMQQKAELQALQSRINPHFLYNSLNSIAGLAKTDGAKTESMALALSDFCRYAINKQNETFSTVQEEAEMAQTYLEIEKNRFGDKFNYIIDIADDCKSVLIPRFVIQPLIENAMKHGISKITNAGIVKLKVTKKLEELKISIFDNGPAFPDAPIAGYGLQNIYDKLELLHKGKASLNWLNTPEKCIIIFLPLESN